MDVAKVAKDWPRYAKALDMRLAGAQLDDIARHFEVSIERARQLVLVAKHRLAFRVFKGVKRHFTLRKPPKPKHDWLLL
jgi:hypothetical protein